jgi:hypothetical protein
MHDHMTQLSHCVTVSCAASVDEVFDFMADGLALGGWALGTFDTVPAEAGAVRGRSLYTGEERYVRPVPQREHGIIVYEVGSDLHEEGSMVPWIWAIVQPAVRLGGPPGECLLSMLTWRAPFVTDDYWRQIQAGHEAEALLIKGQIENGLRRRGR